MSVGRGILAIALLGAAACHPSHHTQATATDRNAVYAAVLDSLYVGRARRVNQRPVSLVVLSARTAGKGIAYAAEIEAWRETMPGIPRDLWAAFVNANAADSSLVPIAGLSVQQRVLLPAEVGQVFPADPRQLQAGWDTFYGRYPASAGIAHLSNIGFSRDANWALVYFLRSCASLCAEGYVVLLQRTGATWRITRADLGMGS
jgi:hypothetical protein